MNRSGLSVCLLATVTIAATGTVQAQELKTMDDVGSALNACWSPPSDSKILPLPSASASNVTEV